MLVMALIAERFGGLRVSEAVELGGFDQAYWGTSNSLEEPLGQSAPAMGGGGVGATAQRPSPT
jgi:hypothetical protein